MVMERDDKIAEFNADIGLLASHRYNKRGEQVSDYIVDSIGDANEIQGRMDDIVKDNVKNYIDDTFTAVMLNNVSNTTNYLRGNMNHEEQNLRKNKKHMENNIHKLRITAMEKQFLINHRRYKLKMIILTNLVCILVFGLFTLNLQNKMSMTAAIVISCIIVFIFIVYMIITLLLNARRRKDDWNKFYFPSPKDKQK